MTYLLLAMLACSLIGLTKRPGLAAHLGVGVIVLGLTGWYWLTGNI